MATLKLDGSITLAPAGSGDTGIPTGTVTRKLRTNPNPKSSLASYSTSRSISSSGAFLALSGIGPSADVQKCNFLQFSCDSAMLVEFTFADPAGGSDIVAILPIQGVVVLELNPSGYIKQLRVKGSGNVEYLASGPS